MKQASAIKHFNERATLLGQMSHLTPASLAKTARAISGSRTHAFAAKAVADPANAGKSIPTLATETGLGHGSIQRAREKAGLPNGKPGRITAFLQVIHLYQLRPGLVTG